MTTEKRLSKLEGEQRKQIEAAWFPVFDKAYARLTPTEQEAYCWEMPLLDEIEETKRHEKQLETLKGWAAQNGYPFSDESEAAHVWLWDMGKGPYLPTPAPAGAVESYRLILKQWREAAARVDCPYPELARHLAAYYAFGVAFAEVMA